MTEKTKCILYVDDDEDDRLLLQEAISLIGERVRVYTAENGLEALELLDQWKARAMEPPCLIVLDLNMPFLNGRETCDCLKKDSLFRQIPVMIYSSSSKPQDSEQFEALGITFITKPSDMNRLQSVAKQMVATCCA